MRDNTDRATVMENLSQEMEHAIDSFDSLAIERLLSAWLRPQGETPLDRMIHLMQGRAYYTLASLRYMEDRNDRSRPVTLLKQAMSELEWVVKRDRGDADAHGYLGSALGLRIKLEGVLAAVLYGPRMLVELKLALALDPRNLIGHYGMAMRFLGTPTEYGGNLDEALKNLMICLEIRPNWPFALVALMLAYTRLGDLENLNNTAVRIRGLPFRSRLIDKVLADFGLAETWTSRENKVAG